MPSPFLSEAIVIVNPATEATPYGGTRVDWDTATRVTAYGFIGDSTTPEGPDASRTIDASQLRAVLNGNPAITQESRIEYRDEVFRVVGRPRRHGRRGVIAYVEVPVTPLGEIE